jgi:hypothetical protein
MSLGEKQELFAVYLPKLINRAHKLGFAVRLKELYRPKEMAKIYHERGTGILNSLHCDGLAVDLVLFKDGRPQWKTETYRELGDYWKTLDILCAWGGDFDDGGHFSIRHGGRA